MYNTTDIQMCATTGYYSRPAEKKLTKQLIFVLHTRQ